MSKLANLFKTKKYLIIITLLIFLAVLPSLYFYNQYKKSQSPAASAQQEAADLVAKVGRLIELPSETPTIATVSDKKKLVSQPFFKNAQNGDKVLIYADAKKAILYRPSTNKIIEVGPINLSKGQANASAAPQASPEIAKTYKVALYDGSTTKGLTDIYEAKIKAELPNVEVVLRDNASKNDYSTTTVVNLSNADATIAAKLAAISGGEVGSLPDGEVKPKDADFLIILGK